MEHATDDEQRRDTGQGTSTPRADGEAGGGAHIPGLPTRAALRMMDFDAQEAALSPVQRLASGAPLEAPTFAEQEAALRPVQRRGDGDGGPDIPKAAARGVSGSGGSLPHLGPVQRAFGRHDVRDVQAHVGGRAAEASAAIGAEAYATGDRVAFASPPDLHTASHEAAHVVQQRAGVQLAGGVGAEGDAYERHADQVADAVVAGESAEGLLDTMAGGAEEAESRAVQRKSEPDADGEDAQWWEPEAVDGGGSVTREQETEDDAVAGGKRKKTRKLGAGLSIKDGKLVGSLAASAGLSYEWLVWTNGVTSIKVGLGGSIGAKGEASSDGLKATVDAQASAALIGGLALDLLTLSLQGTVKADGSLLVTLQDGGLYCPKGIEAGLSGDLKLVLALGGTWIEAVEKHYPEWKADLKTEVLLCKGDFLSIKTDAFHLTQDGEVVWEMPPGFEISGPVAEGITSFYDRWIAREPQVRKLENRLDDSAAAIVDAIDFEGVETARERVDTFEATFNARVARLELLTQSQSLGGEYADEYHALHGDLKGIVRGLSALEGRLIGNEKDTAIEAIRLLRETMEGFEEELRDKGLPTPKERSSGAAAALATEHREAASEARRRAIDAAQERLGPGGKPEEVYRDRPEALEAARLANQSFFKGRDANTRGRYAEARDLFERSYAQWIEVPK